MSAQIDRKTTTLLIDSGADLSLAPKWFKDHGVVTQLKDKFGVRSFDNKTTSHITQSVIITLDFGEVTLTGEFFLADVQEPIIGCDLMKDPLRNLELNTRTETFKVKDVVLKTAASPQLSMELFEDRRSKAKQKQKQSAGVNETWARVRKTTTIPANGFGSVSVVSKSKGHVFLSLLDEDDGPVFVPSVSMPFADKKLRALVQNKSDEPITFEAGVAVGRMCRDSADFGDGRVCAFTASDVSAALADIFAADAQPEPEVAQTAPQLLTPSCCMGLSDLTNREKVDDETLERCHTEGIHVDIELEQGEPFVPEIDEPDVDIEEEKKRSKSCEYWPDDAEFLKQFNLSELDDDSVAKLKETLLSFKHCFYNESRPEMFKEGMRVPPVKIKTIPNPPKLKKEPPRRMNDVKLGHLKTFLRDLQAQGVITEQTSFDKQVFLAPVHIVLEERYVAAEKKLVAKARFCLDWKTTNKILIPCQAPIPLVDEFRRWMTADDNCVYSGFDLVAAYHQLPVETKDIDHLFGFRALGRIFIIQRLSMGWTNSPSIFNAIMTKIFERHKGAFVYLDDVIIASKSLSAHLEFDVPHALALFSKYGVLLRAKKCDFAKTEMRVLGFKVSRSLTSLSCEKVDKIKKMTFPETKKECVSKVAFFSYFLGTCPRLSELMAPLRRLAKPKVKFSPTDDDRRAFERIKEYLLAPEVGVIRTPSLDPSDTTIVMCDASQNSLGGIICQKLFPLPNSPLDPTKRHLFLVACWSRAIADTHIIWPPWLKELVALEESVRKHRHLLEHRNFLVLTDNTTVQHWCSLDAVPADLARRIMRLQQFRFQVLWIQTQLNPSDWLTREDGPDSPPVTFDRFLEDRIVNGEGKIIPVDKLFSEEKNEQAKQFFTRHRRQALAVARPKGHVQENQEDESSNDDEPAAAAVSTSSLSFGIPLGGSLASKSRPTKTFKVAGCTSRSIAMFGLDDERIRAGEVEDVEEPLGDDVAAAAALDSFDWDELNTIMALQREEDIQEMIKVIEESRPSPDKTEVLAKSSSLQRFYRNRLCFRLSDQKVLYRIWINADGSTAPLIVVGPDAYKQLVTDAHNQTTSSIRHVGTRKTFTAMNKRYFAFSGRDTVKQVVGGCPICRLNNHQRGTPTRTGNQLALQPNFAGAVDVMGPLRGFMQTANNRARYLIVYLDIHSRLTIAKLTSSAADEDVLSLLKEVRLRLVGLPRKLFCDNALINEGWPSANFLKSHGCKIVHGLAYVSRCQSKIERCLGSLMRLICKYHTQQPNTDVQTLVQEACITLNSVPNDGLGGRLSPKDVHFSHPPANFLPPLNDDGAEELVSARLRSKEVTLEEVKRCLKKAPLTSPTDFTNRIKTGQLALRKRMVFPTGSPKKMAYKTLFQPLKVTQKIATNAFRCLDLFTGTESVVAGDLLIKITSLDERGLKQLCRQMEDIVRRDGAGTAADRETDQDGPEEEPIRRSRRLQGRQPEVEAARLDIFFDSSASTS